MQAIAAHLTLVEFNEMRPGDIVLFKFWQEPQHVGILSDYPSGGLGLIHCQASSSSVVEQPLSETWLRLITHIYRLR